MERERLDLYLVNASLAVSRARARKLIEEGSVLVNGTAQRRAAYGVCEEDHVELLPSIHDRFVGQGGLKLAYALEHFGLRVAGMRALDIGASTGGFTDCLLQNGASCVYAVDVGHDQLHASLREDSRVFDLSGRDVRTVQLEDQGGEPVGVVTCDVSFISLHFVLPSISRLLAMDGFAVLLVKPQFEVGPHVVSRAGVVRERTQRISALARVLREVQDAGFVPEGVVESPIEGGSRRNVEYLLLIRRAGHALSGSGDVADLLMDLK